MLKVPKNKQDARLIYLTKEEYLQSEVDWLCKDRAAWEWLCHYWASPDFIRSSTKHRSNRGNKPGHKYGADGHVGLAQRIICIVTLIILLLD